MVWRDMRRYTPRSEKMQNVPKMTGIWLINILRRDKVQVVGHQSRSFTAKVPMWCPVVPNTFFVARRDGKVFITGNTPIQGTAGDFVTASLWPIVKRIRDQKIDGHLCNTVHDSAMVMVRKGQELKVAKIMRDVILGHDSAGVPLGVDFKIGQSWGQMEKWKPDFSALTE